MASNESPCTFDVVEHGYSRLDAIIDPVYSKSPVYAETVEISTAKDDSHLAAESETSIQGSKCDRSLKQEVNIMGETQVSGLANNFISLESDVAMREEVVNDGLPQDVKIVLKSRLNDIQESCSTSTPAGPINIETKEETLMNCVTDYDIDYSNIESYVCSEPIIFYHYGKITLMCVRLNNKSFVKTFECSSLGLSDKEALEKVQKFIDSYECISRLTIVEELDFSNISDLVTDVKLSRVSAEQVRLACTFHDDRTLTKLFPGTKLGVKDPATRKTIQDFIQSGEGREWVAEGCKKRTKNWIRVGEVPTGVDTKNFFTNNVKFDVTQRFVYENKALEVIRDKDVLPVSVNSNANWGSSHRFDDVFALTVPPESVATKILARFHIACASLTSKCKTDCGVPLSEVTIINDKLSCCGKTKGTQACSNCMIENTAQWYKMENDLVCNSCYKFYQRRGVHRQYCRNIKRKKKLHESHTKCKWKMKLELAGNDITKWIIYEHGNNAKDHKIEMPCQTRPTISMRDKWDKLRSLAKLTPKQILKSESHLRNSMLESQTKIGSATFQSIKTRATVIDSRKRSTSVMVEGGIPLSFRRKTSWITLEKKYFEHMVFQQRENVGGSRVYHLIILSADCIDNLSELEINVEGYFDKPRFKSGIIVVYYDPSEGVAGAFLISCMEEGLGLTLSHELTFRIVEGDKSWPSVLQQEKHLESMYNFKPAQDKPDVEEPAKVSKRSVENPGNSLFDFSNIMELVSEKPRVMKISNTRVRLQCLLPEGRFLTKVFPCSSLGVKDPETQRAVQEFLDSKDCKNWIQQKGLDLWVRVGEVPTGSDTEQYLCHTVRFEVMQRFFYNKKVLDIIKNGSTMLSALGKADNSKSSRPRSGIHKVDNKFTLKVPEPEVGNKVVATMYIDCASASEHCKTKCGRPAVGVSVIDNCFSCCGLMREQTYVCCNCFTDNSDRWSKIGEDDVLCHTCHNYYRRNQVHRSSYATKVKQKKIHDPHLKCDWKMKLELRGSDVSKWQVFRYHLNKEAHESKPASRSKRKSGACKEAKTQKRMKLFGDENAEFVAEIPSTVIKAFPRYAAGAVTGQLSEQCGRPDENGFLMYPEIKEHIVHLVLRDIVSPEEIRSSVSQFVCDNFLVRESHDTKCSMSTIYEIRTLVKGFIYYVQSDIDSNSNSHESRKVMICLGNAYPTLYFVQNQPDEELPSDMKLVELEDVQLEEDQSIDGDLPPSETINITRKGNDEFFVEVQSQVAKKLERGVGNLSKDPFKIFITTGL